ncbi:MAG: hypothetical protein KatS3mg112_1308 [Thermogutta sp.]|nr:MAG: hypothetical protein KatS3mg112_1308 [Thermogutta sp.]
MAVGRVLNLGKWPILDRDDIFRGNSQLDEGFHLLAGERSACDLGYRF